MAVTEAEIDAVLHENSDDAREAVRALLHDLAGALPRLVLKRRV